MLKLNDTFVGEEVAKDENGSESKVWGALKHEAVWEALYEGCSGRAGRLHNRHVGNDMEECD